MARVKKMTDDELLAHYDAQGNLGLDDKQVRRAERLWRARHSQPFDEARKVVRHHIADEYAGYQ